MSDSDSSRARGWTTPRASADGRGEDEELVCEELRARVSAIRFTPRVLAVDATEIPRRRRRLTAEACQEPYHRAGVQCDSWREMVFSAVVIGSVIRVPMGIRGTGTAHQCRHAAHGCNIVIVYG